MIRYISNWSALALVGVFPTKIYSDKFTRGKFTKYKGL